MIYSKNLVSRAVALFVVILILGYVIFRIAPLVFGPSIRVTIQETEESSTRVEYIDIQIETKRATTLLVSQSEVPIDVSGVTTHRYYLSSGLQDITIEVSDIYGTTKKIVRSVVKK